MIVEPQEILAEAKRQGMNLGTLAQEAGVSYPAVHGLKSGKDTRLSTLRKLNAAIEARRQRESRLKASDSLLSACKDVLKFRLSDGSLPDFVFENVELAIAKANGLQ